MAEGKLVTKAQYLILGARSQGYVQYWEGAQPGSELKNVTNHYEPGTSMYAEWNLGQQLACQAAQDGDDEG